MKPREKLRLKRFTPVQRFFHLALIFCFLIQGATGLARLYIETAWGRGLAGVFGGYEAALEIHKVVGLVMMAGLLLHVLYLLFTLQWRRFPRSLFDGDSLLPHPRDIKHFFQHLAWFFGLARHPQLDRWAYWEKFDYWAVFWGIPLLGITGLLLAYPLWASKIMPGWGLNIALWVHRIEAVLAMAHIFIIHFFVGHLRRQAFPMDQAMFAGNVQLPATEHERPGWVARLRETGRLEALRVPGTPLGLRVVYYVFGYAAMAAGVYLLVGGIVNARGVTWW